MPGAPAVQVPRDVAAGEQAADEILPAVPLRDELGVEVGQHARHRHVCVALAALVGVWRHVFLQELPQQRAQPGEWCGDVTQALRSWLEHVMSSLHEP